MECECNYNAKFSSQITPFFPNMRLQRSVDMHTVAQPWALWAWRELHRREEPLEIPWKTRMHVKTRWIAIIKISVYSGSNQILHLCSMGLRQICMLVGLRKLCSSGHGSYVSRWGHVNYGSRWGLVSYKSNWSLQFMRRAVIYLIFIALYSNFPLIS